MKRTVAFMIVIFGLLFGTELFVADWSQFRYNAGRTAASPEELSEQLYLQWISQCLNVLTLTQQSDHTAPAK